MKNAVIYLHGFGSADKPGRLAPLAARLPNYDFFSPSYNPHKSTETVDFLKDYIKNVIESHDTVVLIGNSMGGFWSDFFGRLFGLKVILLNPALDTKANLQPFVGKHKNFVTGNEFELTAQDIDDLDTVNGMRRKLPHTPRAVMVNKDDPIIPWQHATDELRSTSKVIAFDKGGHQWTNWDAVADELTMLSESVIL